MESRIPNKNGIYNVRICKNGQWQTVILDDYFPCISVGENKYKPVFANTKEDELWVKLLS